MSWVATGTAAVGVAGSMLGGSGGGSSALPPSEANQITRGDKTITFNNGLRLKDVQPLLITVAVVGAVYLIVRESRKK